MFVFLLMLSGRFGTGVYLLGVQCCRYHCWKTGEVASFVLPASRLGLGFPLCIFLGLGIVSSVHLLDWFHYRPSQVSCLT
mgnify:CR=1 FL=1